jgi:hypothetical protein
MSAGLDFANVSTGNVYTVVDPYIAAASSTQQVIQSNQPPFPNGAYNLPGNAYLLPLNTFGLVFGQKGEGAPLVVRYVRYNSTANPALIATPAPVYWTDETFTTVSGVFTEGNPSATGNINSLAGLLLPNTTILPSLTAAQLNGNWCFIAVSGFVPGVTAPAGTAVGDALIGAAGNFTLGRVASGTAPTTKRILQALSPITGGVADVLVDTDWTY